MSEISMYEAQKKKMQGLCDEHDLVYRFEKDRYPIIFTIKPVQGMDAQISMLENGSPLHFCVLRGTGQAQLSHKYRLSV